MAYRRPRLRRLDSLVLGARPDKIAAQSEVPAARPRSISEEQSKRLYILKHKAAAGTLQAWEQLELERLKGLL